MRIIVKIIALLSLFALILPSILFLFGKMTNLNQVKRYMLFSTIVWFIAATLWMWKKNNQRQENST